jgi:hypothetical protein
MAIRPSDLDARTQQILAQLLTFEGRRELIYSHIEEYLTAYKRYPTAGELCTRLTVRTGSRTVLLLSLSTIKRAIRDHKRLDKQA